MGCHEVEGGQDGALWFLGAVELLERTILGSGAPFSAWSAGDILEEERLRQGPASLGSSAP